VKGKSMNSDELFHNSIESLYKYKEELKNILEETKAKISSLNDVLTERYHNTARDKLADEGKDYGSTTLNEDGYKIKVTLSKKVTWDQEGLSREFSEMNPEDARHFAKLSYSVEEKKYNAAQPNIKSKLQTHRVVELRGTTIDILEG
tara:strand:+ start:145 stop:585 length:441 start_codon:yes stop_codon:yes gene_type:complete